MNKKLLAFFIVATTLYGCSSTTPQSIPVVEAGTALSPGALRDKQAREAMLQQRASGGLVTYAAPESAYVAPEVRPVPSAPIQTDTWHEPAPVVQQEAVPVSAPVVSRTTAPTVSSTVAPVAPSTSSQAAALPQIEAPVLALLSTAQSQQTKGDIEGAMASLERAQRIAPREPQVLYRMAEIRLAQGDARQAEQLAQQGLGLASGRPALQAGLWDVIAEAREKLGNQAGAAEAREKAKVRL